MSALVELPVAFGPNQWVNPAHINSIKTGPHQTTPGATVIELWTVRAAFGCTVDDDQAPHVVAELLRIAAGPKTVVMP